MSNEIKYVYASTITLESAGGSAASNAFVQATTGSLSSVNHDNYPDADFCLTATFGSAPTVGSFINLYRQDMHIDGVSADSLSPSTTYKNCLVGTFMLSSLQSLSANYPCPDVPLSRICYFWVENASGANLSAGWTLMATPKSFAPGV